ncbi:hypothetical protein DKX38_019898 [Salix brachista]|uniref:Uncharacterized protein n=1 Tax=Salix brachista TaxID=2182728 RepID=A0A5N5KHM4_9ROSI|nr:hypothetical protein DKX38_019898 [Salix brachista]
MSSFLAMVLASTLITPQRPARIYACRRVIAKVSSLNSSSMTILVIFRTVSRRQHCRMDIIRQISKLECSKKHLHSNTGAVEFFGILSVVFPCKRPNHTGAGKQGYFRIETGFRKLTYSELKRATRVFCKEIGRSGGGIVYKGILSDDRVAGIKQLNEANQGGA